MGSMRKEMAIGFSVITVLLLVLGLLVYRRATAMWQVPEAEAMAATSPIQPIAAIDGRPRVVVAHDAPPSHQLLDQDPAAADADSPGADESYAAPAARQERLHSSFLPRQFEQAASDPANPADSPADETPGDQDPADVDSAATPADADSSLSEPLGGRQTSLEVADGDFSQPDPGSQSFDPQPRGADLPDDPAAMSPDPRDDGRRQDWTDAADRDVADRDAAEGLATSGSMPADTAYNQERIEARERIEEKIADRSAGGFTELDRRDESLAGHQRPYGHQEPERVTTENGKYIVQPNDNYWIIAEKIYGNGAYFKALFEHNRLRHPRSDKLQVGDVLDAPPVSLLADRYPEICPRPRKVPTARQTLQPASTRHHAGERVYVVGEGDTLFDVARHELGRAARWTEIYDLNRDVLGEDFDYLRPGTELVLPRDRRDPDTVTRNTDPVYQR